MGVSLEGGEGEPGWYMAKRGNIILPGFRLRRWTAEADTYHEISPKYTRGCQTCDSRISNIHMLITMFCNLLPVNEVENYGNGGSIWESATTQANEVKRAPARQVTKRAWVI